jgi:hypothetical protein
MNSEEDLDNNEKTEISKECLLIVEEITKDFYEGKEINSDKAKKLLGLINTNELAKLKSVMDPRVFEKLLAISNKLKAINEVGQTPKKIKEPEALNRLANLKSQMAETKQNTIGSQLGYNKINDFSKKWKETSNKNASVQNLTNTKDDYEQTDTMRNIQSTQNEDTLSKLAEFKKNKKGNKN